MCLFTDIICILIETAILDINEVYYRLTTINKLTTKIIKNIHIPHNTCFNIRLYNVDEKSTINKCKSQICINISKQPIYDISELLYIKNNILSLIINDCPSFCSNVMELIRYFKNLTYFEFSSHENTYVDLNIQYLENTKINNICLKKVHIKSDDVINIINIKNINKINLYDCVFMNTTLQGIQTMANLTELNLINTFIINEDLQYISHIQNLKKLYLNTSYLTVGSVIYLRNMTTLDKLSLCGMYILPMCIEYIHNNIKELVLAYNYASDDDMKYLSNLVNLEKLSLINCGYITNDSIAYTVNLINMQMIYIYDCYVTSGCFKYFANMTNLHTIDISRCMTYEDDFEYLLSLQLKTLTLGPCMLTQNGINMLQLLNVKLTFNNYLNL